MNTQLCFTLSNRFDWTIENRHTWIATHFAGKILVAPTKTELMRKINLFDADLYS